MSQAVTATLDIEKIVWTAVRHIFRLVPYDVIELTPHWRQSQWVFATPSVKDSVLEEIRSEHPEIVEKKFFVLEDASGTTCEESQTPASSLQGMASVSLTMNVGELTIGSIRIWKVAGLQQEADLTFDTHQVQLLTMSANTMALALNNATSYHQVQSLATTDGLTGLLNKRSFWASLEKEFKTTARYQTPLSLMMIDIDHFKKINDVFGHQTGDAVLRELAALLGKGLREIDIPARYGGDELAIMLHATPPEQAFFVARRLKTLVERHSFQTSEGHAVPVTVSMGIASCPSGEIHKMEDLVAAADRALYTAKRGGRNRVHSDTALFHQDNLLLEMPVA
jgi:diguanylate cyclase (GGDEF)-like protein